jgi:hypothetical protein
MPAELQASVPPKVLTASFLEDEFQHEPQIVLGSLGRF